MWIEKAFSLVCIYSSAAVDVVKIADYSSIFSFLFLSLSLCFFFIIFSVQSGKNNAKTLTISH